MLARRPLAKNYLLALITRRPQVQILPPQPKNCRPYRHLACRACSFSGSGNDPKARAGAALREVVLTAVDCESEPRSTRAVHPVRASAIAARGRGARARLWDLRAAVQFGPCARAACVSRERLRSVHLDLAPRPGGRLEHLRRRRRAGTGVPALFRSVRRLPPGAHCNRVARPP